MAAAFSYETLVTTYQCTRCHRPGDHYQHFVRLSVFSGRRFSDLELTVLEPNLVVGLELQIRPGFKLSNEARLDSCYTTTGGGCDYE
jgi:hypothetical protein